MAGSDVETLAISADDPASIEDVRTLIGTRTAVLVGRSGVGKSRLVNLLVGTDMLPTAEVRAKDGKGRHTTVSREIIELKGGGRIIDMPGIRGLGLWEADAGIESAFADIEQIARQCRFRDCKHDKEPGCAVRAAVEAGQISQTRFESYQALRQETADMKERREQARWMTPEQTPASKRAQRMRGGIARHSSKRNP